MHQMASITLATDILLKTEYRTSKEMGEITEAWWLAQQWQNWLHGSSLKPQNLDMHYPRLSVQIQFFKSGNVFLY
jgi:peptidoglycan/LPS O-acetylase OafA/YrhL